MILHEKQFLVLDFIKQFIASHGYSPTIREMCAGLGYKSPSSIQEHLKKLISNGFITMNKNKSRTIELLVDNEYLNKDNNLIRVPLLNNTIENEIATKFIEIPSFMIQDHDIANLYAFKYEKSIFIIDRNSRISSSPSLTIEDNSFFVEEKPLHKVYGNIISEFKQY